MRNAYINGNWKLNIKRITKNPENLNEVRHHIIWDAILAIIRFLYQPRVAVCVGVGVHFRENVPPSVLWPRK